jgi:hypothetical protein
VLAIATVTLKLLDYEKEQAKERKRDRSQRKSPRSQTAPRCASRASIPFGEANPPPAGSAETRIPSSR